VKDCVKAVLWLLENANVSGLFNVGSGKARTFRDLVLAVARAVGREARIRYIDMPEPIRHRYQYFTEAGMQKARAAGFGQEPYSLEEGVGEYIRLMI
jgi:ADP-L-glycero-D-manno-heptose 6-epimerase